MFRNKQWLDKYRMSGASKQRRSSGTLDEFVVNIPRTALIRAENSPSL
jgi:hypothetical protein